MARFGRGAQPSAGRWPATDEPHPDPDSAGQNAEPAADPAVDTAALGVARGAVRELAAAGDGQDSPRLKFLSRLTVNAADPDTGFKAVAAAARMQCLTPRLRPEADRKAAGEIARFLVWHATINGTVDAMRAFRRASVEEYLSRLEGQRRYNGERQLKYTLYRAGRALYPREYPAAKAAGGSRGKARSAYTRDEIEQLELLVPMLSERLGRRAQALIDLTYRAGARAADFRSLRGTAITTLSHQGHAIAVVNLPNRAGGVRKVPVVDRRASGRLLELAAGVGDRLVLTPHTDTPGRNTVNRVSEDLVRHGHPRIDPVALRNAWIIGLASAIPAALLMQLADLTQLQAVIDHRKRLPHYEIRSAITIMREAQQ